MIVPIEGPSPAKDLRRRRDHLESRLAAARRFAVAPFLAKLGRRATALLRELGSRGGKPDWRRNRCFFSGVGRTS